MRATDAEIEAARAKCPTNLPHVEKLWDVPVWRPMSLSACMEVTPNTCSTKVITFRWAPVLQNDGVEWCWGYVKDSP